MRFNRFQCKYMQNAKYVCYLCSIVVHLIQIKHEPSFTLCDQPIVLWTCKASRLHVTFLMIAKNERIYDSQMKVWVAVIWFNIVRYAAKLEILQQTCVFYWGIRSHKAWNSQKFSHVIESCSLWPLDNRLKWKSVANT